MSTASGTFTSRNLESAASETFSIEEKDKGNRVICYFINIE